MLYIARITSNLNPKISNSSLRRKLPPSVQVTLRCDLLRRRFTCKPLQNYILIQFKFILDLSTSHQNEFLLYAYFISSSFIQLISSITLSSHKNFHPKSLLHQSRKIKSIVNLKADFKIYNSSLLQVYHSIFLSSLSFSVVLTL